MRIDTTGENMRYDDKNDKAKKNIFLFQKNRVRKEVDLVDSSARRVFRLLIHEDSTYR